MQLVHGLDMVAIGRLGMNASHLVDSSRHQCIMKHQLAQILVIIHYLARGQDFLFEIFAQQTIDCRTAFRLQKVVIRITKRCILNRRDTHILVVVFACTLLFQKNFFDMSAVGAFPITNNPNGGDLGL